MFYRCIKVQHKPIERFKLGFKTKEQKKPKRTLTGASDCPVCHRTVSDALGTIQPELFTFGFLESRSTIIHQTVRCASRATAGQRNGQLQRSPTNVNSAQTVRVESEQHQKAY